MVKEGRPKFNPRPGRRLNLGLRLPQENGNRVLFKMALTDYEKVNCVSAVLSFQTRWEKHITQLVESAVCDQFLDSLKGEQQG